MNYRWRRGGGDSDRRQGPLLLGQSVITVWESRRTVEFDYPVRLPPSIAKLICVRREHSLSRGPEVQGEREHYTAFCFGLDHDFQLC